LYRRFIIPYPLPGLNEYIEIERQNKYAAAQFKKKIESGIVFIIKKELPSFVINDLVNIQYHWYEKDKRRDKDNIAFAKKFIQDALVHAGVLRNDGWGEILGFTDTFMIDKKNPRVVVGLEVVSSNKTQNIPYNLKIYQ